MMAGRKKVVSEVPEIEGGKFPRLDLPVPIPFAPMEAERSETIPSGEGWQYEPKWDGFRALIFRLDEEVAIQSKAGQPLGRYFPELVATFLTLKNRAYILDGEIVIEVDGKLSFDDLLLRLHPAASRIAKLSVEIPARFLAFDILFDAAAGKNALIDRPLEQRRELLEKFFAKGSIPADVALSPSTNDHAVATKWFDEFGPSGLDGIMAKRLEATYRSGERDAMVKVKRLKEADCVVGGFRYGTGSKAIGSLLLGLYDAEGVLHHVGSTSSFTAKEKKALQEVVEPLAGGPGFGGRSPGPSRWSKPGRSEEFVPLAPRLVCEVRYDYFTQGRFRHGTKFLRWRPEKAPESCTFDQVEPGKKEGRGIVSLGK